MKKLNVGVLAFAVTLFGVYPAFAQPVARQSATLSTPGVNKTLILPAATENATVISLGTAIDEGRKVEGYAIIHYKKGFNHKPNHTGGPSGGGSGGGGDVSSSCFTPLSNGAKWKTTEPYVLDTTNADGLSETLVSDVIADGLNRWDNEVTFDIFGIRDLSSVVDGVDTASTDGKNEIMFGTISEPGVIAVTIVWGIFGGRPSNRQLVEFDLIFDDADFTWGNAGPTNETGLGDINLMDLENIAVHELGHAAGLADLYTPDCVEQTMYGFAEEGETKKRTLNAGDIAGINNLY